MNRASCREGVCYQACLLLLNGAHVRLLRPPQLGPVGLGGSCSTLWLLLFPLCSRVNGTDAPSITQEDGEVFINGKKVDGFSGEEERIVEASGLQLVSPPLLLPPRVPSQRLLYDTCADLLAVTAGVGIACAADYMERKASGGTVVKPPPPRLRPRF